MKNVNNREYSAHVSYLVSAMSYDGRDKMFSIFLSVFLFLNFFYSATACQNRNRIRLPLVLSMIWHIFT